GHDIKARRRIDTDSAWGLASRPMRRYLLRRVLLAPFLLLGILSLTFLLVHLAPGSPFTLEQTGGLDPRAAIRLRAIYGADDPLPVQYLRWLGAFVSGDFGVSLTYRRPVAEMLLAALPPTLMLASCALIVSVLAGVTAACAASLAAGRLLDRIVGAAGAAV